MSWGTSSFAVLLALSAPDESTPASSSQPWISSAALEPFAEMSSAWEVIPPMTSTPTRIPMARSRRSAIPAAPPLPTR